MNECMKKKMLLIFLIFYCVGILGLIAGCSQVYMKVKPISWPSSNVTEQQTRNGSVVRIALLQGAKSVKVSAPDLVDVYDMDTRQKIGTVFLSTPITLSNGHIMINQQEIKPKRIRLVTTGKGLLKVDQHLYRGQIEVIGLAASNKGLLVINFVALEDYLKGVVPNEVAATWPIAALRAQAVAARTFALSRISDKIGEYYDLENSVNSQVYLGADSEKTTTNQAVADTEGLVATYNNRFIAAFYHSNCGGQTADVKTVWGSNLPYLGGVSCGFCQNGPHYAWKTEIDKDGLAKILKKHNVKINAIEKVEVLGRDNSGRINILSIEHNMGQEKMKAAAFRMAVGADRIKSTNFFVQDLGDRIRFSGQGWGHGVGFCQEGALGMAKSGYSFEQILRAYYPGIQIQRLDISEKYN